jgi:hypothetical protein
MERGGANSAGNKYKKSGSKQQAPEAQIATQTIPLLYRITEYISGFEDDAWLEKDLEALLQSSFY